MLTVPIMSSSGIPRDTQRREIKEIEETKEAVIPRLFEWVDTQAPQDLEGTSGTRNVGAVSRSSRIPAGTRSCSRRFATSRAGMSTFSFRC